MEMITSSDGVELALHRLGGQGPIVVLVHGNGMCGMTFEPLAAALATDFYSVAPDLRGHGDAATPRNVSYDWTGFAEDVTAVVRAINDTGGGDSGADVFAFGHSLGGAAVLRAEELNPGLFTGIYCYEPVVMPAMNPNADGDDPLGARRLARIAYGRQHTFPSIVDAYANFASRPPFDALEPGALWAYVSHGFASLADGSIRLKCPGIVEARIYQMAQHSGVFEALDAVKCPVTIGIGNQSKGGPAQFAGAIADALPAGRVESFDGLGHFGPLQAPKLIAHAVRRAFLN